MAVTITTQPPEMIAAYSDITMSVSSNMVVSKYKFKYVYDIFVATNASTGFNTYEYVGRVKQTPNPTGYGILDLSRYLQLQLSGYTYNGKMFNFTSAYGFDPEYFGDYNFFGSCKYYVMCGEEYANTLYGNVTLYNGNGTVCSGTTLTGVQTITGTSYNGVNQFEEGYNPNMSEFFITSGRTITTNSPRTLYKEQDENWTFGYFGGYYSGLTTGSNSGFDPQLNYSIYNSSGTLLTGSSITYAQIPITSGSTIQYLNGGININQIVSGYTNSWNKVVINFGLKAGSYPAYTESFTIINKGCPWDKYDPKDVIWLNRYGSWDTFRFYGSKNEDVKIERGTYKRAYGTWSNPSYSYNTYERGTTNIKTDLTVEGEVMSDFIDKDTVNWLEELLTSPSIFFIEDNKIIPINITDNSFKRQVRGNVKLRQVSFKYEKSNQVRTQQQS